MVFLKKRDKFCIIWAKYCKNMDLAWINRAGFWRLGYYAAHDAKSVVGSHPQNDYEHSHSSVVILSLLKDFFPKKFGFIKKRHYDCMSDHELGELVILDICDDGSADTAAKDERELELMREYLKDFPKKARKRREECFRSLQSKDDVCYLVDKFDFLLGQLYLIKNGFKVTDITSKRETGGMSPADKHYSELTDTKRSIDVCFAHALDNTSGIVGREYLIGIVEAAYADVGMEVPEKVKDLY